MKLIAEAGVVERALQRVDAVRHEQRRPFVPLREEVAHRPIERARHPDRDAVDGDERERAVDGADGRRVAAEHAAPRLLDVDVVQLVQAWVEQIDDAFDRSVHARILPEFT